MVIYLQGLYNYIFHDITSKKVSYISFDCLSTKHALSIDSSTVVMDVALGWMFTSCQICLLLHVRCIDFHCYNHLYAQSLTVTSRVRRNPFSVFIAAWSLTASTADTLMAWISSSLSTLHSEYLYYNDRNIQSCSISMGVTGGPVV